MRIAIDARYVNDHFPGIGRYIYNLLQALATLDSAHTFVVLHNPDLPNTRYPVESLTRYPSIRLVKTRIAPFSLAAQVRIPQVLRNIQAQLFHAPYYVRPYAGLPCPSVVTLYDIIPRRFPSNVPVHSQLLFDRLMRLAIGASQHILVLSESARSDIATTYGIPPQDMTVTPLAADSRFGMSSATQIAAMRQKYQLPPRYVLSLASNKPHKNLPRLVEAWGQILQYLSTVQPPVHLVIAGHWDERYPAARERVKHLGLEQTVRFLPNVIEEDMAALYSGAMAFVFPSLYEGFGLPPLEAMACGVPALCGNTSSLPEVVGHAALRVDTQQVEAIAQGLTRLLTDDSLRERLKVVGQARAARFSWRQTAETTLSVYERVGKA
ncbi:MAG: glycosyltransferase family 4 protein [Chloroflexi bacterium AL-W]|nr:glycosyltransferase family 4 protein [Chloroflexi bacterium AL-N1]NOK69296.1 glycosyltransferase family 4 protein [Chloroflexi bacterium AL-N10]NOK76357.1 glycosyltransferase family 4 protein [Chloroflexi bacterium AL-N5]NOK83474.1 glycosyltransferase family 4 protein [Chloroflexi bacterium AL-W]NOK91134.1 glycosyltransferase family 4 protein [Chloroflexi bacterium AL-N15]